MATAITEPVGKVHVFSEYGHGKYELDEDFDDKPTAIKVSQVKTEEKAMTPDQTETIKNHINNSVSLIDACLETKKALLDTDEAKNKLGAIQGLGDIIKGVVKLVPGGENPMVGKLQKLEDKIGQLGEKVSDHFDELKSLMTEVKFIVRIMSPTAVLTRCMRDCLRKPGPEAVDNFRMAYFQHSPVKLAYSLISFLEQTSTNPLRVAMDNEQVKSMDTFHKWESIICRILEHLVILEAFAAGILIMGTQFNIDLLLNRSQELWKTIITWKDEYFPKNNDYWKEMKEFLEPYVITHTHLNNDEKAKAIKAKLDGYRSDDAFYIFVFNQSTMNQDVTYYCPNDSNLLTSWNKGKCSVMIYRSRLAYKKTSDDYRKVQQDVENNKNRLRFSGTLRNILHDQFVKRNILKEYGFLCLIDKKLNVAVQSANCPNNKNGPGATATATIKAALLIIVLASDQYTLCASFD